MKKHFKFFMAILGLAFFALFVVQSFVIPDISWSLAGLTQNFEPISLAMSGVAFTDVSWKTGDNMGGYTASGHLILVSEVLTFPTKTPLPTTPTELVTITGAYTMNQGKKAYSIRWWPNSAGANSDSAGEPGSQCFEQKPKFFIHGTELENIAMATLLNNSLGILFLKNPNTGTIDQFGCEDFPLSFKASVKHGESATDKRGVEVEGQTFSNRPNHIYTGTLPLTPAV